MHTLNHTILIKIIFPEIKKKKLLVISIEGGEVYSQITSIAIVIEY